MNEKTNGKIDCCVKDCKYHTAANQCTASHINVANDDAQRKAEAFGATGYRCRTIGEFRDVMAKALQADGPVIIDAIIDKDERVLPFIPAGQTIRNVIID